MTEYEACAEFEKMWREVQRRYHMRSGRRGSEYTKLVVLMSREFWYNIMSVNGAVSPLLYELHKTGKVANFDVVIIQLPPAAPRELEPWQIAEVSA